MIDTREIAVRRSGWQTLLDVFIAPQSAFASLRDQPAWLWAFIVSAVLGMVATFAISPIIGHFVGVETAAKLATDPQMLSLSPSERQSKIATVVGFSETVIRFSFIIVPIGLAIGSAVQALVMLIANAIGKGDGTFKKFWALSVNCSLIGTGLSSVALAVIVLLRGTDGFATSSEISSALARVGDARPVRRESGACVL